MTLAEPQVRRWTRDEYYRLAEEGWFAGERVLLIKGDILRMAPQGHPHAKGILNVFSYLQSVFGAAHCVRPQMPLNLFQDSDPEPDIAVTEHPMSWYKDHPTGAMLVVEVSDSSIHLDRRKAGLYAAAGIPEYWILNLNSRKLEVFRSPIADPSNEFGHGSSETLQLGESDMIAPTAKPDARIAVKEFFA
jgi:Uma2 family endonuclease